MSYIRFGRTFCYDTDTGTHIRKRVVLYGQIPYATGYAPVPDQIIDKQRMAVFHNVILKQHFPC